MVTSRSLGVVILADSVRAVELDRTGRVTWFAEAALSGGVEPDDALDGLLAHLPGGRSRRRAIVAVGPSRCQARILSGMPGTDNPDVAWAMARENMTRFFLRDGVPLQTARPVRNRDGNWCGAAFESPLVSGVSNVLARRRIRLAAIVPAVAVAVGDADAPHGWRDGHISVALEFAGGVLRSARRVREVPPPLPPPQQLETLGERAGEFAPAWWAARADLGTLPLLGGTALAPRPLSVRRWVAAWSALCIAAAAFLAAPAAGARAAAARLDHLSDSVEAEAGEALRAREELRRFGAALTEFAEATRMPPRSLVLAELTAALPDSAAVISLRMDSTRIQVVVLAPRMRSVLDRLERSAIVGPPALAGPVVRELVAGMEVERATVHAPIRW
jgi:hypothetical protein